MKRLRLLTLTLLTVLALLTGTVTTASAATQAQGAPYATIQSDYSADVTPGVIRYISQVRSGSRFHTTYWGSWASSARHECGTASISMALSYIGINETPKAILNAGNGSTCFSKNWGGATYSTPSVATAIDHYLNGGGAYSPPVIHLPNYSSNGHWVVIVAKLSDSRYQVLDPWEMSVTEITINGTSASYQKSGSTKSDRIDRVYQWYNASLAKANTVSLDTPELTGATCVNGGVKVTWNAVSGAAQYRVFRKVSGGGWERLGVTSSTSFTDTTAKSGTAYTYTVRCLSADGNDYTSGYNSKGKSVTYVAAPTLTGVSNTTSGVKVTWSAVSGAAQYRVFRKVSGGGWERLGVTSSTSYTDTTAKSGTAYTYTVRCLSADGKSYTSSYDSKGKSIAYVAAPTLTGVSNTTSGVKVTWSAVNGAAQYRVFRKVSGGSWERLGVTSSTSFTDTTAKSGTTYIYTVRCLSANGKSYTSSFDSGGLTIKRK